MSAQTTEELSRTRGTKPTDAQVQRAQVLGTARVSPGFVRVTIGGVDGTPLDFTPCGHDQWLRLFLPADGAGLHLPWGASAGWYSRWLAMDERLRPTIRNYTVRAARHTADGWVLDLDFVVHAGADGSVEGVAARWALVARPGDLVGILDQGALLHADDAARCGHTYLLCDETGLPGLEGIAASLPEGVRASAVVEIACEQDRRPLPSRADLDVTWVRRPDGAAPGSAVRAVVEGLDLQADAYVYAVGEGSFALAARGHALGCGVPKDAIDFCAYWRPERRAAARTAS